jgi:murein DD-endopeptidase MepM/ murein hydrolase activator NlpD
MPARRFVLSVALATASWAFAETVTVRPGDTLWALAQRYDTSVEALMEANDRSRPDLRPGETLVLPGGTAARPEVWTVRSGDTLYDIAAQTGTTVEQLTAWNDLAGTLLQPGQELLLGAPAGSASSAPAEEATPLRVEVRPGDSLWRIAREHDLTPDDIASANGIAVDATLQPGDTLVVPGHFVASGASSDQGGYAAPTITVDPGDTLWEIAGRYDTTVAALMAANDLDGDSLRAGQELRIVARDDAGSVSAAVREQARPAPASSDLMLWPLRGAITSRFGWRPLRIGGSNMHYGVDIDGQTGDPVVAATPGVVTFSGWMGGYGKLVIVERGDTEYYYAHASELLVGEGQRVEAGQAIARVGTTGRVTGSHLHFEIRVDGSPIDPMPVLQARAGRP